MLLGLSGAAAVQRCGIAAACERLCWALAVVAEAVVICDFCRAQGGLGGWSILGFWGAVGFLHAFLSA